MLWKKIKKKTLTISSNLKKKIDTSSISSSGKKSFSVEKKNLLDQTNHLINYLHIKYSLRNKKKILQENLLNNKQQKILLKKIINLQEKAN